jgi:hypothetical protein
MGGEQFVEDLGKLPAERATVVMPGKIRDMADQTASAIAVYGEVNEGEGKQSMQEGWL